MRTGGLTSPQENQHGSPACKNDEWRAGKNPHELRSRVGTVHKLGAEPRSRLELTKVEGEQRQPRQVKGQGRVEAQGTGEVIVAGLPEVEGSTDVVRFVNGERLLAGGVQEPRREESQQRR